MTKDMDIVDCARLFALTSMAANDALIAVFDAKYTYNLWLTRYRDPKRGPDQQPLYTSRCLMAAAWRHADAPGISVRALHFIGCSFCCSSGRGGR